MQIDDVPGEVVQAFELAVPGVPLLLPADHLDLDLFCLFRVRASWNQRNRSSDQKRIQRAQKPAP